MLSKKVKAPQYARSFGSPSIHNSFSGDPANCSHTLACSTYQPTAMEKGGARGGKEGKKKEREDSHVLFIVFYFDHTSDRRPFINRACDLNPQWPLPIAIPTTSLLLPSKLPNNEH